MKKPWLLLFCLLLSAPVFAQVENNKIDLSAGYLLRQDDGVTNNGWYGELSRRAYKGLYLLGAAAGTYSSAPLDAASVTVNVNSHSLAGGVRVFSRYFKRWSPFVDALVGGYHASGSTPADVSPAVHFTQNGFVSSFGLGVDYRFRDSLSIRVRPAYNFVGGGPGSNNGQATFQTGLVYHFGR